MDGEPRPFRARLPRLTPEHYRGRAFVHWTMTIADRAQGWLTPLHHARFREMLCHALGRRHIACATYCLMPDHAHLLLCGTAEYSDQRLALRDIRTAWNRLLAPTRLQLQAHDHVLRESERAHGAFQTVAHYILDNPCRAGLCAPWREWPYSGALVPGYPELDPRLDDYWERFWRLWNRLSESAP
ncbi:MAG: hypothetical protein QM691_05150 [Opitutaceae bacterium]